MDPTDENQQPDPAMVDAWLAGTLSPEDEAAVEKWFKDQPDFSKPTEAATLSSDPEGDDFFDDIGAVGRGEDETPGIDELLARITRSPDVLDRVPLADDAWREVIEATDRDDILGTLGHYEVLEVIAIGGMGIVFRALDPELKRVVALKVLAPDLAANATARERFLREARAAATLEHENILPIHGVVDDGIPWFAMRYAAGGTLQDRLDRNEVMDIDRLKLIARQVAQALDAAHAKGIVHRDIKPANLLFDDGDEHIWVCDFGIARSTEDPGLTYPGTIAGTPKFMSPEQADGRELDGRSDLFSLGAVLYQCATGELVFRGATTAAVLRELGADEPTRIEMRRGDLPTWFGHLLKNLLAKDPDDRPDNAAAVVRAVEEEHSPPPRRRRRRIRRVAIACAVPMAVLLVVFFLSQVPAVERATNQLLAQRYEREFFIADRIGAYRNLAGAIAAARDGDTILLPPGDPVFVDNLLIRGGKSLTLVAADPERRSVLTTEVAGRPGLVMQSPTRFHGIDFVVNAQRGSDGVLIVDGTTVNLNDCSFFAHRDVLSDGEDIKAHTIELRGESAVDAVNCDFDLRHTNAITVLGKSGDVQLKDCNIVGYYAVDLLGSDALIEWVNMKLEGVTFTGERFLRSSTREPTPEVNVQASASHFTCAQPLCWFRTKDVRLVRSRTKWIGRSNSFRLGNDFVQISPDQASGGRDNVLPLGSFGDSTMPVESPVIEVEGTGETFSNLQEAVAEAPDGATLYLKGHVYIPVGTEILIDKGKALNFLAHPESRNRPTVEALDGSEHGLFIQGDTTVRGLRFMRRNPKRNSKGSVRPLLGLRCGMEGKALIDDCEFLVRRTPDLHGGFFSDGLSVTNTGSAVIRRCFFQGGKALTMAMVDDATLASEVRIEDCVIDSDVGMQLYFRRQPSVVDLSIQRCVFRGEKFHIAFPTTRISTYRLQVEDCLFDLTDGLVQFHGHDAEQLAGSIVWSGKNNFYRKGIWTLQCLVDGAQGPDSPRMIENDFEGLAGRLPGSSEVAPRFVSEIFDREKLRDPITPASLYDALSSEIDSPAVDGMLGFRERWLGEGEILPVE